MKSKECLHLGEFTQSTHLDTRGFVKPLRPRNTTELPFDAKDVYISSSRKGVFRGLHVQFSTPPPNKLVSIIQGSIIALSICCNKDCTSFGELTVKKISNESSKALIIPKLQAFGYLVLENNTLIATCIDQPYSEADELGINPTSFTSILKYPGEMRISLKDQKWPNLDDFLKTNRNN